MKIDFNVQLTTIPDVQDFVNIASTSIYDVTVSHGRYIVDGKSLMGIFSLNLSNPIKVTVEADGAIDKGFLDKFAPYIVDERV